MTMLSEDSALSSVPDILLVRIPSARLPICSQCGTAVALQFHSPCLAQKG
jgi:hypothetical protein